MAKSRIGKNTQYSKMFKMTLTTDHVSPALGKVSGMSIVLSKAGAPFVSFVGSIREVGFGWYAADYSTLDTDVEGDLAFHATAPGCDPMDDLDRVNVGGIKQHSAYTRMLLMVSSNDHILGAVGKDVTVMLSKAGGTMELANGHVQEINFGWYACYYTVHDTNILGDLALHATAAGCDPTDDVDQIIPAEQVAVETVISGMPLPSSALDLIREAFQRAGVPEPTPYQFVRAENHWLQDALRQISARKRWKALEDTQYLITFQGVQTYPIPPPLSRVLWVKHYAPSIVSFGPLQSASTNTVTFLNGFQLKRSELIGRSLYISSGPGFGQVNTIVEFNEGTRVATLHKAWKIIPTSQSLFGIADSLNNEVAGPDPLLEQSVVYGQERILNYGIEENQIVIYPTPFAGQLLEVHGIVDPGLVEKNDPRMTRLYREWRVALVYGLMKRVAEDNDDMNMDRWDALFEREIQRLMVEDNRIPLGFMGIGFRPIGGMPVQRW